MSADVPLTPEQLQEYDEQGFLVVPDVFAPWEVEEMARAFDSLAAKAATISQTTLIEGTQFVVTGDVIHRVVWCAASEPVLSRYGKDRRLVSMAAQILESPSLEQLINQGHFKYPGDEVAFDWHQDSRHRRYGTDLWDDIGLRGSFVETATAIDPMTGQNGPLRFIPGSHKLGHIPPDPETGELPPRVIDESRAVTITMDPGSVALFGPFTLHASSANQSTMTRRVFLNGFATPGANSRVYPGEGAGRVVGMVGMVEKS